MNVGGGVAPVIDLVTDDSQPADSEDPIHNFQSDKERGVKLKTFVRHTETEHITLVISQVKDDPCTHILLTHIRQNERRRK